MQTIKDRVIIFIQSQGITVREFERKSDLSNGAVSKMGNNTRSSIIENILKAYPDINRDWLLKGNGEMLKSKNEIGSHQTTTTDSPTKVSDYRLVPLIQIDSVGGIHSPNSLDFSEQYVIRRMPFTEAQEGDVAILQSGNSMYPTIPAGSALLIRQVVDWQEYFGYGNIYVLWLRDGRRITKEIRRYDANPRNYVWCVSYNPDVADEELPRSMIRGVWKVIKYIADLGW